ncbi:hypothetical protein PAEPH01_2028 [Pancytospora epiphaga]|nr:hypothetical protein PAEPH01_2028 [Pancytospora epiphaga]
MTQFISTGHHQSNGRVERVNRTIREYIRKFNQQDKLEERVGRAIYAYNNALHSAIKMTPNEAWTSEFKGTDESKRNKLKNQNKKENVYAKGFKKNF